MHKLDIILQYRFSPIKESFILQESIMKKGFFISRLFCLNCNDNQRSHYGKLLSIYGLEAWNLSLKQDFRSY